jgi:GH24 family phage-related lysozyme (muramidase)
LAPSDSTPADSTPSDSTAPADGFNVSTGQMQSAITALGGVADSTTSTANQFQGLSLDSSTFGGIGVGVGDVHDQLSGLLGSALSSANQGFTGLNSSLGTALGGYINTDYNVADSFGTLANPDASVQLAAATPATTDPNQVAAADPATDTSPTAGQLTAGQQMTEGFEGPRNHVYNDTEGHPTVGIGFNLDRADAASQLASVGADYHQVRSGQADLTDDQMNSLFANDYAAARQKAADIVGPSFDNLNQARQDVVTDMTFNMNNKVSNFHTMLGDIRSGDYSGAADAMLDSRWAGQVGNRATEDAEKMRNGQ